MPEIDLPPDQYRVHTTQGWRHRVTHAKPWQLTVAVVLAIWAGFTLVLWDTFLPARIWSYVVGFGPMVLFWLWFALFDD